MEEVDGGALGARVAALLDERGEPPGELRTAIAALRSALTLAEAALVARDEQLAALDEMVTRIGFPVLQVRRDTVCVPLIGVFDGERGSRLAEILLARAVEQRIRTVVLDLTGVVVVDAGLVEPLSRTILALRLVGAEVLLSGIQPESATYFVGAGVDLAGTRCFMDVASALAAGAGPQEGRRG